MSQEEIQDNHSGQERSEEVQAIIDRMPTYWVKWFAICVGTLMGIIVLLGFAIEYPDTIEGEISITAKTAPVRLVAKNSGRIRLVVENRDTVENNEVVAYIENGANYRHILQVDSLLQYLHTDTENNFPLPDSLLLGDVSTAYNSFFVSYMQYKQLLASELYETMRRNLEEQIYADSRITDNLESTIALKRKIAEAAGDRLQKDSVLYEVKGISQQEFVERKSNFLSIQENLFSLNSNLLAKKSEISRNRLEMQRIMLEEQEAQNKAYTELTAHRNVLSNAVNQWKENFLIQTPIDGELEYLGFWRNNTFIQSGQELFTVIPDRNGIIGEMMISSYGAGKVEKGQTVNVKINNYPYEEYGMLKGRVHSISRITKKIETANGQADCYLVEINFPNGMSSNFGKLLSLDFESKGVAEIVTKRKKLIERLFDNLKSKGEK